MQQAYDLWHAERPSHAQLGRALAMLVYRLVSHLQRTRKSTSPPGRWWSRWMKPMPDKQNHDRAAECGKEVIKRVAKSEIEKLCQLRTNIRAGDADQDVGDDPMPVTKNHAGDPTG
jgi:hypothetical protein